MRSRYEPIPPKAGHVVAAAVWQMSDGRFRLRQVCYEPRRKREAEPEPTIKRRQGLLL